MTKPAEQPKQWTPDQAATAAQIWQDHLVDVYGDDIKSAPQRAVVNAFQRIAVATGREYQSAWNRYSHFGPSFGATGPRTYGKASAHALAELATRKEAELRQSPIAALLGEPLPGYSALDKRKQQDGAAR